MSVDVINLVLHHEMMLKLFGEEFNFKTVSKMVSKSKIVKNVCNFYLGVNVLTLTATI